jgi:hypothetical protein
MQVASAKAGTACTCRANLDLTQEAYGTQISAIYAATNWIISNL